MMSGGFRFLEEHTSDVYIEAYGDDLEEAFENAALAFYNTLTSTENVSGSIVKDVEVSGEDLEALLVEWLQQLIVLFDVDRFVASRIEVHSISKVNDKYFLKAKLYGEEFDPSKHKRGVYVKGATYWRMEIFKKNSRVFLRFVLDI